MATFKEEVLVEYPVPLSLSIWEGDNSTRLSLVDWETLVSSCLRELRSDLYIVDMKVTSGMNTTMPDDCITVSYAKLRQSFPGNRIVTVRYEPTTKVATVTYYPAQITFRRYVRREDLDNGTLQGDSYIYFKTYLLWKMADKELQILKSINLDTDNASINLDALSQFAAEKKKYYEDLKPEILVYASVR